MPHEMLTEREQRYLNEVAHRVEGIGSFLGSHSFSPHAAPAVLFEFLATLRQIQGNLSNDVSFAATLMAKQFLVGRFGVTFDAAEKPQGAPGIDIELQLPDGKAIAAEIKTTVPYQPTDFGAQQAASFKKDFAKLTASSADIKFLFVTDARAYSALLKPKYLQLIPGVTIVNLSSGAEHAA